MNFWGIFKLICIVITIPIVLYSSFYSTEPDTRMATQKFLGIIVVSFVIIFSRSK